MIATLIFVAAVVFILYVLFGYPLFLALLSRGPGSPIHKAPLKKSVSVVMPVRNGALWISRKIENLLELDYPPELLEIIVVSDGSTDGTADIVRSCAGSDIKLIELPPGGKAVALTAALTEASGDILFFT